MPAVCQGSSAWVVVDRAKCQAGLPTSIERRLLYAIELTLKFCPQMTDDHKEASACTMLSAGFQASFRPFGMANAINEDKVHGNGHVLIGITLHYNLILPLAHFDRLLFRWIILGFWNL